MDTTVANKTSEFAPRRPVRRVVVLTALGLEYSAVRSHLGECSSKTLPGGTIYEVGRFEGQKIDWEVAVAEIGAGTESAAVEATKAIGELKPDLLLFVGVAGSLKPDDAPLGSVVVAESVLGYESGKDSEDFAPRAFQLSTWYELRQLAQAVARTDWDGGTGVTVLVRPIAVGNVVVGSSKSKTYERIRRYYSHATAVEMESTGLYLAAERSGRRPVLSVRGISDCIDDKTAGSDEEWQPVAARNAASFAFATLAAIGVEEIGSGLTAAADVPERDSGKDWASIPFTAAELLQKASESSRREAESLLALLANGKADPEGTLQLLLEKPPEWLLGDGTALLWAAVGEFATSHGLHEMASEAFARAGEFAGENGPWRALAALATAQYAGVEDALRMLEAANDSAELPKGLLRVALTNDLPGVLAATEGADGTDFRASAYRIQALRAGGRVSEALDLAQKVLTHHPGAAGTGIVLSALLLQAAHEGVSPLGYDASLMRAREIALTARDLRRGWGGDSVEAAVIAGHASIMLRDPMAALNISSLPEDGSALATEASSDELRHVRVDALLLLNRDEDALTEAGSLSNEATRRLAQADCLRALGRTERAAGLYSEVVVALESSSADDPESAKQLFQGLIGLAELGVWPLPTALERLRGASPEAARKVDILSAIARGQTTVAMKLAREGGDDTNVGLLVQALTKAGQPDDAVSVLKDAAARFSRNEFLLEAVRILAREKRFGEAYQEAVNALAVVSDGTPVKSSLRRAAVDAAAQIADWDGMLKQARAAVAAGDTSVDIRWALVIGLNNTMALEDSLAEAIGEPALVPRTESEARLLISLHSTKGNGLESILAVLDAAESYPESEEVGAAAVGSVFMLSKGMELPEDARERLAKASANFFDRYPDSDYLKRIEGTPERILEMLEAAGDPWNTPEVQDVVERIRNGTLPLSLLAEFAKKPYSELLVKRGIGWIVGESIDPAVRDRERAAAIQTVGHPVVVETSAVVGAVAAGMSPDDLLGLFPQVMVAQVTVEDSIRGASNLALRSTSSMHWDSLQGKGVLEERTAEEADQWASDAEVVERTLRAATSRVPTERADEVAKSPLTLQPVQLAKELGVPLYSDDVAIRMLAASEGVVSFGTASVLVAAQEHGVLSAEQAAAAVDALRRNRYADLDWPVDDLIRIAEQEGFRPSGGASGALGRPSFWLDPVKVTETYMPLVRRLAQEGLDLRVAGGWQAAATFGFLGALPPAARRRAGGGLLSGAFVGYGLQPEALPHLLGGAREGAIAQGVDDVLPDFCRSLIRLLTGIFGEAQAATMYVEMIQELGPEDRAVAVRELLARKETGQSDE